MGSRLRLIWDIFIAAAIVGITSYIIYDAVADNEEKTTTTTMPTTTTLSDSDYAESIKVCTNPHQKLEHPEKYPESPLDEYVWRDG